MRDADEKRQGNTSKGLIIGLSAGGVAYVLIQLLHIVHGIQQINESQKKIEFKDAYARIILTDPVTGKKDTMLLIDYVENKNKTIDTTAKTEIIYPK